MKIVLEETLLKQYVKILYLYIVKPKIKFDEIRKELIKNIMKEKNYYDLLEYKNNYLSDDINEDILANRFKNNKEIFEILTGQTNENFKGLDSLPLDKKMKFLVLNNEILDYNYENKIIDDILNNSKNGFIKNFPEKINKHTIYNIISKQIDINNILKNISKKYKTKIILNDDINASIVSGCLFAKLKYEYNKEFDIYFQNFYNKFDLLDGKISKRKIYKLYNSYNKNGIATYYDQDNYINMNISNIVKSNIDNAYECETEILDTIFHEFNHVLKISKNDEMNKTDYILNKNLNSITKNQKKYEKYHDYYELEQLAIRYANEQLNKTYNRSSKNYKSSSKLIYSNKYDKINSLGKPSDFYNKIEKKSIYELSTIIDDKELLYQIILNKNIQFKYTKEELILLKEALQYSKNIEYNKVFSLADEDNETFKKYFQPKMKKIKKIDKKINRIKI